MPLKIVFAGTPEFGVPALEAIYQSEHEVVAVYTQPDRPSGRGKKYVPSPVKSWALERDIGVYQPVNFREEGAFEAIANIDFDVMVVIAYGLILPQRVLDIPPFGCINVHASLLPRWRGASPIQQSILHGDKQTGVCIMKMEAGLDTGPVYERATCVIEDTDTTPMLHDKLAQLAIKPLLNTLSNLALSRANLEEQSEKGLTYAHKISREDALIDWSDTAVQINQKIRAYKPWPSALSICGDQTIKIHQAECLASTNDYVSGTIVEMDKTGMSVACGEGVLLVKEIQYPNSTKISIQDYINSGKSQLSVGAKFD